MPARTGTNGNNHFQATSAPEAFDGLGGWDTVSYTSATSGIRIDLTTARLNTGLAAGDTFVSIEALKLTRYNDRFAGSSKQDVVNGETGNDTMSGRNGNDALSGHAGNDIIQGDAGNDSLWGGGGNDTLKGNSGNDKITGDGGNDTITGGTDSGRLSFTKTGSTYKIGTLVYGDTLKGGAGSDTFVYANSDGVDRIQDFAKGFDRIDIAANWFDGVTTNGEVSVRDHSGGALIMFTDSSADGFVNNRAIYLDGMTAAMVDYSMFI